MLKHRCRIGVKAAMMPDRPFAALVLGFAATYLWITRHAGVRQITDSFLYQRIAAQPVGFDALFENMRPPLYPFIIRLCGDHLHIVVGLQILAYFAAWLFLAWTFYRPLRRAGRPAVAALLTTATFYAALYPDFAGWTLLIMTESFSLSALVLSVALIIRAALYRRPDDILLAAASCTANTLLRDANAYFALCFMLPIAVLALRHFVRFQKALPAVLLLAASAWFSNWSSDHVDHTAMRSRWVYPMLDIIGRRILPDPEATRYFAAHGMPMNADVRGMSGEFAYQGHHTYQQFIADPQLDAFRQWLAAHGKNTYLRYVLSHPGSAAHDVWQDRADLFAAFGYRQDPYPDTRYTPDLPADQALAYDTSLPPRIPLVSAYLVGGVGSLAFCLAAALRRDRHALSLFMLTTALFAIIPLFAFVVELGDCMETARHAVMIPELAVMVALAVLFFALMRSHVRSVI
jgi:hypothetical protein